MRVWKKVPETEGEWKNFLVTTRAANFELGFNGQRFAEGVMLGKAKKKLTAQEWEDLLSIVRSAYEA